MATTAPSKKPRESDDDAVRERILDAAFNAFMKHGYAATSTLEIASQLKAMLPEIRQNLPAGVRLTFFYDQSLLVHQSVQSVWNAIVFGLILSLLILYLFLKSWPMTLVAIR